jgi:large subunit ribosomal protein L3
MPRVGEWPLSEKPVLLGYAGYKAGMSHIMYVDQSKSHLKGRERFSPVTVIEVPEMIVYGARLMYHGQTVKDVLTDDKDILIQAGFKKRAENPAKPEYPEQFDEVYALMYTQPAKTTFGKKKIEKMIIGVGGTPKEALEYVKSLINKKIKAKDVFSEGQYVDIIAITKGKGWQGPVKRFGIATQRPKSTGKVRHVGNLGPFKPAYVPYEAPQAGQVGYHKRTEINKLIVKMGADPNEINPSSGFSDYGIVKNDYILLKGSIPGPKKRLVRLRLAIRKTDKVQPVQLSYVSKEPQN